MIARGSRLRWLRSLARNILNRRAGEADLRADIESYVELLADEKIAAGLSPDRARRAARLEVGVEAVKEEVRAVRAGALPAELWQDAIYAGRMARRDPGFTLVAVLTLALGIGANTAIFSVVHTVLLEPLSYRNPDRLVVVWERNLAVGKDRDPVAPPNFNDWKAQNTVFDELAAYRLGGFALSGVDDPEQIDALTASSGLFRVLGVEAAWGRAFTDEEERRRDRVVLFSHEFWQRRFGGDRTVVGRSISLNGGSYVVVGVMPPGFRFPDGNPVEVYTPLAFTQGELTGRRNHTLTVIGRLKEGATREDASADLGAIARGIAEQDRTSNPDVNVIGAHDLLVEDVRVGLVVLLATVGFVLLIACANVANLLLVRATARRGEVAIRAALGAGRPRLIRQLLTESVLLAFLGGTVGTLVAWGVLGLFVRVSPPDLTRIDQVGIDPTVLLFATAIAVLTGIGFGIAPAVQASRSNLIEAARNNRFGSHHGRSLLVVSELALSLMLLAGAGLMIRSFLKLQTLDHGFEPQNVLTAQIFLPGSRYPIDPAQFRPGQSGGAPPPLSKPSAFFAQLIEKLTALPGVQSAGAVTSLPLNPVGIDFDLPVVVQGRPRSRPGEEPQADFRIATPDYFRTMKIPLLRGRDFTEFDGPAGTPVVIINETMARQMFPGEDPLGRRLLLYGRMREIVGLVGSVRHRGFSSDARAEMILPYRQFQLGGMTLPPGPIRSRRRGRQGGACHRSRPSRFQGAHDAGIADRLGRAAPVHDAAPGLVRGPRDGAGSRRRLWRDVIHGEPAHARDRCANRAGCEPLRCRLDGSSPGDAARRRRNHGRSRRRCRRHQADGATPVWRHGDRSDHIRRGRSRARVRITRRDLPSGAPCRPRRPRDRAEVRVGCRADARVVRPPEAGQRMLVLAKRSQIHVVLLDDLRRSLAGRRFLFRLQPVDEREH
jgi:predicted permease